MGGVLGFWGGVFGLGLLFLVLVGIRRFWKGHHWMARRCCCRSGEGDAEPREVRRNRAHLYKYPPYSDCTGSIYGFPRSANDAFRSGFLLLMVLTKSQLTKNPEKFGRFSVKTL